MGDDWAWGVSVASRRGVGEPIYAEDKDGNVKPKSLKINNTKPYVDELESLSVREGHQTALMMRHLRALRLPMGSSPLMAMRPGFSYAHDPENLLALAMTSST